MPRSAIIFGLLLIVVGLVGFFSPATFGDGAKEAPTALIPAGIGAVLLICGLIAVALPNSRKHIMHLAAVVGVVGAIGGIMPLRKNKMDFDQASVIAALLMIALCVAFVVLCVRSFVRARIAKSTGLPDNQEMN